MKHLSRLHAAGKPPEVSSMSSPSGTFLPSAGMMGLSAEACGQQEFGSYCLLAAPIHGGSLG